MTLPSGTPVDITQTLGGSYTVHAQGGLYRIAAKDADALGISLSREQASHEEMNILLGYSILTQLLLRKAELSCGPQVGTKACSQSTIDEGASIKAENACFMVLNSS